MEAMARRNTVDGLPIKNGDFPIKNDDFPIKTSIYRWFSH